MHYCHHWARKKNEGAPFCGQRFSDFSLGRSLCMHMHYAVRQEKMVQYKIAYAQSTTLLNVWLVHTHAPWCKRHERLCSQFCSSAPPLSSTDTCESYLGINAKSEILKRKRKVEGRGKERKRKRKKEEGKGEGKLEVKLWQKRKKSQTPQPGIEPGTPANAADALPLKFLLKRIFWWKPCENIQRRSWYKMPSKLHGCIGFLYKVVPKTARSSVFIFTIFFSF